MNANDEKLNLNCPIEKNKFMHVMKDRNRIERKK